MEAYHKSLKERASLEKSSTQTVRTQTKGNAKLNHFAIKSKLYLRAIQSAYAALRELQPVQLIAQGE